MPNQSLPAPDPTADTNEKTTARALKQTRATVFETAEGPVAPIKKGRRYYVPLVCDLGQITVEDAVETATTLVTELGLYPGKNKKLRKTYIRIQEWAAAHGATRLREIVDDTAAGLICDLAKVPDLQFRLNLDKKKAGATAMQARADVAAARRRAHRIHNVLVSLRAAAVMQHTRPRHQRTVNDTLALGLPRLPSLEDRKSRPLTDEEILLARFMVEIDLLEAAPPRVAIAYLIAESGIRSVESIHLDTHNLDDPRKPTTVTAPGAWEFGERTIDLTEYAVATLPRALAGFLEGQQLLTHASVEPGSKGAHSSVTDVLIRHLRRAGVLDPDITTKSLSFWRVQDALVKDGDMKRARAIHGGGTRNVLADLKLHANERDILSEHVHLQRRHTDEVIASIPNSVFYDDSYSIKGRGQRNAQQG